MNLKRLMLAAGVSAALLGGLAPLARATGTVGDVGQCFPSGDNPVPAVSPGEGLAIAQGSDSNAPKTCSYTSTGKPATYKITGLSAWTLTLTHGATTTQIDSNAEVINGGIPPVKVGSFTPANGDVITLTAKPSCDPSGSQCGTVIAATVGSDPQVG